MANIYQNSFLTIAASAARNDGETLYRVMDEETAKVVELTGSTNDGEPYQIFARRPVKHYLDGIADTEDFPDWPLVRRAWAFQERILAPRILHFGHELVWECREASDCECSAVPYKLKMQGE